MTAKKEIKLTFAVLRIFIITRSAPNANANKAKVTSEMYMIGSENKITTPNKE